MRPGKNSVGSRAGLPGLRLPARVQGQAGSAQREAGRACSSRITTYFAKPQGFVTCPVKGHDGVRLPVVQGILKHPDAEDLRRLLRGSADAAEKYTREALRHAAWPILRAFPRNWLLKHLKTADVRASRRRALRYLLS
jgi:hypothetical protein